MSVAFFMATTGFSIYEHYCGDNLVAKSLFSSDTSCSPSHSEDECTSKAKMDCCKDDFQFVQLDVELKNPEWNNKSLKFMPLMAFLLPSYLLNNAWETDQKNFIPNENPPPPKAEPIYILQQQLVYYG